MEKAGYVSVVRTNDVTVAFILQFVVLGATPFWTSIVGALLIILSSVGINIRKWLAKRKEGSSHQEDGSNQGDGNHRNSNDDDKPEEERLIVDCDHNYDDNELLETQGDE